MPDKNTLPKRNKIVSKKIEKFFFKAIIPIVIALIGTLSAKKAYDRYIENNIKTDKDNIAISGQISGDVNINDTNADLTDSEKAIGNNIIENTGGTQTLLTGDNATVNNYFFGGGINTDESMEAYPMKNMPEASDNGENNPLEVSVRCVPNQSLFTDQNATIEATTSIKAQQVLMSISSEKENYILDKELKSADGKYWYFNAVFYEQGQYTIDVTAISDDGQRATDSIVVEYPFLGETSGEQEAMGPLEYMSYNTYKGLVYNGYKFAGSYTGTGPDGLTKTYYKYSK